MTNAEARFNKIHICKVYACLAVTCHLHFWQNDRDFLRATVVTQGWNGYRNKSQHRKSTLEKKILPPFQQGFERATFQSRVRCSNNLTTELSPPPKCVFRRLVPLKIIFFEHGSLFFKMKVSILYFYFNVLYSSKRILVTLKIRVEHGHRLSHDI